jgi:hypothetical protein
VTSRERGREFGIVDDPGIHPCGSDGLSHRRGYELDVLDARERDAVPLQV